MRIRTRTCITFDEDQNCEGPTEESESCNADVSLGRKNIKVCSAFPPSFVLLIKAVIYSRYTYLKISDFNYSIRDNLSALLQVLRMNAVVDLNVSFPTSRKLYCQSFHALIGHSDPLQSLYYIIFSASFKFDFVFLFTRFYVQVGLNFLIHLIKELVG